MKKFWGYISAFLGGGVVFLLSVILILKNKISSSTIEIKRPKIKNSSESKQDFTSEIINVSKKANKESKKEQRRQKKLIKKQNKIGR